MKITKLHIEQYRNLENLTFDFTYQSGERKGQPLDKICFIGQSATGKTSILELIYEHNFNALNLELINGRFLSGSRNGIKNINGEIEFFTNGNIFTQKNDEVFYKNKTYKYGNIGGTVTDLILNEDKNDIL